MTVNNTFDLFLYPSQVPGKDFPDLPINYTVFVLFIAIVVPHITDAIQEWVERVAKVPVDGDNAEPEVCIIEVRFDPQNRWGNIEACILHLKA